MTLRDRDDPAARASEETRTRQDGREIWRGREAAGKGGRRWNSVREKKIME